MFYHFFPLLFSLFLKPKFFFISNFWLPKFKIAEMGEILIVAYKHISDYIIQTNDIFEKNRTRGNVIGLEK